MAITDPSNYLYDFIDDLIIDAIKSIRDNKKRPDESSIYNHIINEHKDTIIENIDLIVRLDFLEEEGIIRNKTFNNKNSYFINDIITNKTNSNIISLPPLLPPITSTTKNKEILSDTSRDQSFSFSFSNKENPDNHTTLSFKKSLLDNTPDEKQEKLFNDVKDNHESLKEKFDSFKSNIKDIAIENIRSSKINEPAHSDINNDLLMQQIQYM